MFWPKNDWKSRFRPKNDLKLSYFTPKYNILRKTPRRLALLLKSSSFFFGGVPRFVCGQGSLKLVVFIAWLLIFFPAISQGSDRSMNFTIIVSHGAYTSVQQPRSSFIISATKFRISSKTRTEISPQNTLQQLVEPIFRIFFDNFSFVLEWILWISSSKLVQLPVCFTSMILEWFTSNKFIVCGNRWLVNCVQKFYFCNFGDFGDSWKFWFFGRNSENLWKLPDFDFCLFERTVHKFAKPKPGKKLHKFKPGKTATLQKLGL